MSEAIDNLTKMDVCDLLTSLVGATLFDNNTAPYISQISNRFQHLRDENARLREALKPFAERWEYFERTKHPSGEWPETLEYADDEPSTIYLGQLKAAKNALDGGKGVQGGK